MSDRLILPVFVLATISLALGVFLPVVEVNNLAIFSSRFSIAEAAWELMVDEQYLLALVVIVFSVVFPLGKIFAAIVLWQRFQNTGDAPVRFLFRAIASGRAPAAAFEHVAAVVQRQGDATGAIPLYRAVLRQQPENADLHANLAAALIESGAVDAALAALETALTLDPDLARARWMRAWITLSTGNLARGYADSKHANHVLPTATFVCVF